MKYIYIVFLLVGCAEHYEIDHRITPSDFKEFIELFESITNTYVNVRVVFGELGDKIYGKCYYYSFGDPYNYIEINKNHWDLYSYETREQLILHELGHCVMGLAHNENLGKIGELYNQPLSIMYPYTFGYRYVYQNNKAYYFNELKNNNRMIKNHNIGGNK